MVCSASEKNGPTKEYTTELSDQNSTIISTTITGTWTLSLRFALGITPKIKESPSMMMSRKYDILYYHHRNIKLKY